MANKAKKKRMRKKPALRLEWVKAGTLNDNPANWRRHPAEQMDALREILADPEVGWAGVLLYNERTGRLIDGHARKAAVAPDDAVPVLIGSWSAAAEQKILVSLDPLAALAETDDTALEQLLEKVEFETPALGALTSGLGESLEQLRQTNERAMEDLIDIRKVQVPKPPKMTWVLIGIPTVRYGEISRQIEKMAGKKDLFCEVTANNG